MKLRWIYVVLVVLCAAAVQAGAGATLLQGRDNEASPETWGGMHVTMEVSAEGATLQFDCAQGAILQPIRPNAKGEFSVSGTYTPEHGGPVQKDNPSRDLPAIYKGAIAGDTMHLEIVLSDKNQQPEPFILTRGKTGRVVRCY